MEEFDSKPVGFLHRYAWEDRQFEDQLNYKKTLLLPSFYSKWNIKTNKTLTYQFRTEANFMDIQKLAQGWVIQDYYSVFTGNRALDNGYFQNHALNYNHFDFFSGFNLFGNMNWQRKRNELGTTTDFIGINRFLSVMKIEPINEPLNGDLMIDKSFNKLKIQGGGRWNAFSTNTFLDDLLNENRQFSQTYNVKGTATFLLKVEIDLGYTFETNRYSSFNIKNTFSTHSPKIEVDWDIWKGLKLNADYTFNAYLNKGAGTKNNYEFFNAFLSYQGKSSPWEFRLRVWIILDTQSIRRDSFTENLISTYPYFFQPRYGLITVKWDI